MVQSVRRSCRRRSAPIAQQACSERQNKRRRLLDSRQIKSEPKDAIIPDEVSSFSNSTLAASKSSKVGKRETSLPDPAISSIAASVESEKSPILKKDAADSGSVRPTREECEYAVLSLGKIHSSVVERNDERRKTLLESCGMRDSVTDAIISTMLSQNTTDANSKAAFKTLKQTFPNWEDVAVAKNLTKVEHAIRVAGLAKTRAERMQIMLRTVKKERGVASLDYIRDIPSDDNIKKELSRFKGLGPKTISCVLLFALGRSEFPVDTHVLRISKKIGWISDSATRESAYDHLNAVVPSELKLDLHCLLVYHGKYCHRCAANGRPQFPAKDGSKIDCPLKHVSKWAGSIPTTSTAVMPTSKGYLVKNDKIIPKSVVSDSNVPKIKHEP